MTTEVQTRSWKVPSAIALLDANPAQRSVVVERGAQKPHRCPACNSVIYSRRNALCGVCGNLLPEDRLFTPTEAKAVTQLLSMEKQRHRQWLSKGFAQALTILV